MDDGLKEREQRYDVAYHADHTTIEPHFCREWDEDGGCYGTNPNHGFTLDEAIEHVAKWHDEQAALWRSKQHHEVMFYLRQETDG